MFIAASDSKKRASRRRHGRPAPPEPNPAFHGESAAAALPWIASSPYAIPSMRLELNRRLVLVWRFETTRLRLRIRRGGLFPAVAPAPRRFIYVGQRNLRAPIGVEQAVRFLVRVRELRVA